jgi:hypothetical protein
LDQNTTGLDWTSGELIVIVSDYFSMLQAELQGRRYSKAEHRRTLLSHIHRSEGSIEFKHQNISAVLQDLGLPWIPGYKPRSNYQTALLAAVEEYLGRHPLLLGDTAVQLAAPEPSSEELYVAPPGAKHPTAENPTLTRLLRKFDPAARDARNRRLGKAGEEFVLRQERRRLAQCGRSDLAEKVLWIAEAEGDGAGYDILSFDRTGAERLLEVKTTCGGERTPFYLTRNELAEERSSEFRLVRVHQFFNDPKIFVLAPPLAVHMRIEPVAFRAAWG